MPLDLGQSLILFRMQTFQRMKNNNLLPLTSALVLALVNAVYGQYTPPPPPAPFPGFINEALRKDDPYMNVWDFGGAVR